MQYSLAKKSGIFLIIGMISNSLIYPPYIFAQTRGAVDSNFESPEEPVFSIQQSREIPATEENTEIQTEETLPFENQAPTQSDTPVSEDEETNSSGELESQPVDPPYTAVQPQSSINVTRPEVDLSSGALTYNYPFRFPPGRNGFTPELSLSYNSQNREDGSMVGFGWNLNIPHIVRENKHGIDKMYNPQYESFSSSIDSTLVSDGTYFYARAENGAFNRYEHIQNGMDDYWELKTKQGLIYTFGKDPSTQQGFLTSPEVYKWMIEKIEDANGNEIKYTYTKEEGQIYPEKIEYMFVNPGSGSGFFTVNFQYDVGRGDTHTSYASGFEITTNKRLIYLDIKENTIFVRRYLFSYDRSGVNRRSRLISIQEIGDPWNLRGGIVALPSTNFNYTDSAVSFVSNTSGQFPATDPNINTLDFSEGIVIADINNDGYADMLQSAHVYPQISKTTVWINNHDSTFTASPIWQIPTFPSNPQKPVYICYLGAPPFDYCAAEGLVVFDIQGDARTDYVYAAAAGAQDTFAYINNGSNWVHDSIWDDQIPSLASGYSPRSFLGDVNGDGLPDHLKFTGNSVVDVNHNTGTSISSYAGYADIPYWRGLAVVDLNHDGLDDVYRAYESNLGSEDRRAYINHSILSGEFIEETWGLPGTVHLKESILERFSTGVTNMFFSDFNGDLLPDYISDEGILFLNSWKGWTTRGNKFGSIGSDVSRKVGDINGDGLLDVFVNECNPNCSTEIFYNTSDFPDLMDSFSSPTGGTVDVIYKTSAEYKDINGNLLNPDLPFIIHTVETLKEFDPVTGVTGIKKYDYANGSYYFNTPQDKKFAGFESVTEALHDNSQRIMYFHQGNITNNALFEYSDHESKIGKLFRTDVFDANGNRMVRTTSKWGFNSLPSTTNPRFFVKKIQDITEQYDGNATHNDTAQTYGYDSAGNLDFIDDWGVVTTTNPLTFADIGNDDVTIDYEYATDGNVMQLVAKEFAFSNFGGTGYEIVTSFDNLPYGQITRGNVTKVENYIGSNMYASTTYIYNNLGLVTESRDPNNNSTFYGYDAFNLYPTTFTNALNQATHYEYNYSSGGIKKITDPNSVVEERIYDSVDRVKKVKISDPLNGSLVVARDIVYNDAKNQYSVTDIKHLTNTLSHDTITYFDGFGRVIQTRSRSEDFGTGQKYNVSDIQYDGKGRVLKVSLPYQANGSAFGAFTNVQELYTNYVYDALDRVIEITNVRGTTVTFRDDWTETITDPKGNVKKLRYDAFGRLVRVSEYESPTATPFDTTYEYNLAGKLTKITDAFGNVRNFTYDILGRRLSAEDIHDPSDTTFGVYTFIYDDASNLIEKQTPNGDTIVYDYDALNRLTTEDFLGSPGSEVTYDYDSCIRGIGRLCNATKTNNAVQYIYNYAGGIDTETKQISGAGYVTIYGYDYQGNLTKIRIPNIGVTFYTYGRDGRVKEITWKEGGTNNTTIIASFSYTPIGTVKWRDNNDGTLSHIRSDYDPLDLYRLKARRYFNYSGEVMQAFDYEYDAVGNITKIDAFSDQGNSDRVYNYQYDGLNRLTSSIITAVNPGESYTETFTYDAIGNILTGPAGTYLYDGNFGQSFANPHAVTSINGTEYAYDQNGNLTSKAELTEHVWDYNNRLISYTTPTPILTQIEETHYLKEQTATYDYDPSGVRVAVTDFYGIETHYPNDYLTVEGNDATQHIFANSAVIATIEQDGINPPYIMWHGHDHLNSTTITTDIARNVLEETEYTAFGEIKKNIGTHFEERKYTGHEFDAPTEYTYAEARYLDNSIGRFISQDMANKEAPEQFLADPQQLNTYSYGRNNPLVFVDPNGEKVVLFSRPLSGFFARYAPAAHVFVAVIPENSTENAFSLGGYTDNIQNLYKAKNRFSDYQYIFDKTKKGVSQVTVEPPDGLSVEEFEQGVLDSFNTLPDVFTENSYGATGQIRLTNDPNSNNVTTDILLGAGVSRGDINSYQKQLFFGNRKFTPGLGQSAFSITLSKYAQNQFSATLKLLGSGVTRLQTNLLKYAHSLIPNK